MERQVGEIFTYEGKTYQVVKSEEGCTDCTFRGLGCDKYRALLGHCSYLFRTENTSVIFKEVKKYMEIKNNQLTIDIPEGMEIDLENSDLAKGIVKFKPKNLTYEYILHTYAIEYGNLVVSNF